MPSAALNKDAVVAPLEIAGICKSYGSHTVLQDVSLSLQPGEIFGLIGVNGAGKTTLIKLILDLARANAGEVRLFGVPATKAEARSTLSYLPEKFSPSRYLCGHEYLSLVRAHYGLPFDRERAEAMVTALDLDPSALKRKVGSYSKGMGQKLGLAGAFLLAQPLVILDEPMSGLDPSARIKLKAAMRHARAQGKTIFFSSHILADIDEICDRIGVIHDAKLLYTGTPAAFKPAYGEVTLENAFLKAIHAKA